MAQGVRPEPRAGVEANARLTGYAGVVLLVLLALEGATILGIRRLLVAHALIGFALIPPMLLKLGSTGYRFVRYYSRDASYRAAGPPQPAMRVLGPVVVLLTVAVLGTGVELWVFGLRFGEQWVAWHKASFLLWFAATGIHVLVYAPRALALAAADWRDNLGGAFSRRSLVVASVLLGAVLGLAMLPLSGTFVPLPEGR